MTFYALVNTLTYALREIEVDADALNRPFCDIRLNPACEVVRKANFSFTIPCVGAPGGRLHYHCMYVLDRTGNLNFFGRIKFSNQELYAIAGLCRRVREGISCMRIEVPLEIVVVHPEATNTATKKPKKFKPVRSGTFYPFQPTLNNLLFTEE